MTIEKFPKQFGKYLLLDRLNSGGMADVYIAKLTGAEEFERFIAIKRILPELAANEVFADMFIDEAKMAAQLSHANIVQIFELGKVGDELFIAMDLISGHDLKAITKKAKEKKIQVPIDFAAYVIAQAAEGLDFAHRKKRTNGTPLNLIHRDVSPQNILVSYDGEVKVVDFGIAKAEARSTKTQAGVLKGKFAYMSPEQIIDQDLDRRSDIFALGSVLFEVITGTVLFSGDSDFQVLEKIRDSETPQISDFVDNPPKRLQIILEKALAKEPEDRFEWASDMADDLLNLRLSDDGLFASKQASKFMKQLYKNDLEDLQRRLVEYEKLDLIKIKRDESLPAHQKETAVIAASPELLAAGKPEKTTTVQNIDLHTKSDSNITGEVRRSKGRTIPIEGQTVVSAAPKGMNTLDKRSTIGGIAALVFIVGLSATFFFSRSSNENNENQQPSEPTQQTAPVVEATPKTAPNAETAPEKQKDSKSAVTQEEENKKVSAAAEAKEKEAKTEAKTEKKKTPKKTTPVKRVVPTDPNGKLSILAMGQTQCKVSVAGRTIGTIPLFDYKIPAGTYTVKVKCKNGKSFVASRKIRRGKVTKLMIKPSDWK